MYIKIVTDRDLFYKEFAGASAIGPFVVLKPDNARSPGYLAHERVHVKQWWTWVIIFGLLWAATIPSLGGFWHDAILLSLALGGFNLSYGLSKWARMHYEAAAYAAQAKTADYPENAVRVYARSMVEHYNLGIDEADARNTIRGYM